MVLIREVLLLLVVTGSAWGAFPFKRSLSGTEPSGYNYETKYFTQKVDHLDAGDERTFQQRYLINADHWKEKGPIFFYTGNEGDITWFCNNTGFMWDIAPQYNALIVFAEHRYYGKSLPFGNDSYKDAAHLNYLTSEQALADFAVLIDELKTSDYATSGPVIAFGGSYGGMLAAWFRMKYPNVVHGSLAASAPIWFFTGLTPCNVSYNTITHDFEGANPNCSANIRNSWAAIEKIATESGGLAWLSSTFKLCEPLTSQENVTTFSEWLAETWFDLAMVDYPYPANFLEPLPAWPINVTCEKLAVKIDNDDHKLMEAIFSAVSVYYNSTGSAKCLDIFESATSSLGDQGWYFQACTEMVMPMCSDGIHDMFQPDPWNITAYTEECEELYGVKPDPYWVETLYGGKNISAHSNIVFSNGLLDPWSGGGVLHSISDSLVAVILPNGAHHLDLRAATNADPPDLKAAREVEMQHISKWIAEYWDQKKMFCN